MKIQKKQAIGENLLYVMVWTAIILVPVLNSQMMSEMHVNLENVLTAWRYIAPYLIIFLIHNAIIAPRYMLRRKYGKYLASNLALIISVFWLVQIYEDHLTDHLLKQNDPEALDAYRKASFSNLEMYWNVVLGFFMTGANTGIKLIYQSMRDEQQMEALKRQNLQAEMDYLKYQINPHFFMNTLNNIHALIDIDTESAKNAVIELSKMMRYVLYESGREIISLNRDIQFLKNYIELMRIRLSANVRVETKIDVRPDSRTEIAPLIFISLIENAFKHGISPTEPSFIRIHFSESPGEIHCEITNSYHPKSVADKSGSGIGLEQVRKRLELTYPDRYDWQQGVSEDMKEYKSILIIKI